jgi:hypothetical protein
MGWCGPLVLLPANAAAARRSSAIHKLPADYPIFWLTLRCADVCGLWLARYGDWACSRCARSWLVSMPYVSGRTKTKTRRLDERTRHGTAATLAANAGELRCNLVRSSAAKPSLVSLSVRPGPWTLSSQPLPEPCAWPCLPHPSDVSDRSRRLQASSPVCPFSVLPIRLARQYSGTK